MNTGRVDIALTIYNISKTIDIGRLEVRMHGAKRVVTYNFRGAYNMHGDERILFIRNTILNEFCYDKRAVDYVVLLPASLSIILRLLECSR